MKANGFVYGKLRVCVRGFSEGKSEASKQSNKLWLSLKKQFFIYAVSLCYFYILLLLSIVLFQE